MAHTFYQNFGHLIFHIDKTAIRKDEVARLHAYLAGVAREHHIEKPVVGGTGNHIHLLGNFPVSRPISDTVSKLKASSSRWLKSIHSQYQSFSWQQGYSYFSVSYSQYPKVARYINSQEEHHAHMSAETEQALLLEKHGWNSTH